MNVISFITFCIVLGNFLLNVFFNVNRRKDQEKNKREKKGERIYDPFVPIWYDPFAYISERKDINIVSKVLFGNYVSEKENRDPFLDDAAELWLKAMIGYLWYEASPEEQNIPTLLEILEKNRFHEETVDMMFTELRKKDPENYAVKYWNKYTIIFREAVEVREEVETLLDKQLKKLILYGAKYKLYASKFQLLR